MITIKNKQRKINLNSAQLKSDAQKLLNILGYTNFDLGILITTNATIRKYNKSYRHKDKPTDILSFAYHQIMPGEKIIANTEEDKNLGDLIISAEYVTKQIQGTDVTFDERIRILLVHGICHLLGYDHETDTQYKQMHRVEMKLLKTL